MRSVRDYRLNDLRIITVNSWPISPMEIKKEIMSPGGSVLVNDTWVNLDKL